MLEVRGLCKNFGGLQAINNLNLDLAEGQLLGVIGPNGAGKTTLLNLITGYLTPTAGTVSLNKKEITGLKPFQVCHAGIARTFQVVQPFTEMTVMDNVITGALFSQEKSISVEEARELCADPLRKVGLLGKQDQLAGALTLGELKKLEFARALATGPKILFLDEVMAGLTRGEVEEMMEILAEVNKSGVTILMIEHLVHVILQLADWVFVLNFGEELFQGTSDEVMSHPEVIESYLGRPLEAS
ncbi:MAG: ABC transporter ATP-binding protein [Gammaproteobacteria bacterium CG12_big_fil_rev_8_21_14_0_65_46_12]|nr:MAG: ABC transporter ATP-binding protein [Gammaproteobacteria bacterium CG12_big_fil_rev_8_21_14_0_65_46_12]